MTVVIIFGASLFAILSFLLGSVFNILASMFNSALYTLDDILPKVFKVVIAMIIIFIVFIFVDGNFTMQDLLELIIALAVAGGLLGVLFGMGSSIIKWIGETLNSIPEFLEKRSIQCNKLYIFFLKTIINNLEKY